MNPSSGNQTLVGSAPGEPPPATIYHRDLSLAVACVDAIDDRVRRFLGARARSIHEIIILAQTRYPDLSTSTRRRLGMSPGQFHLLLRLVIHDPERTMTGDEANEPRDAVFGSLHEGGNRTWISRETQL